MMRASPFSSADIVAEVAENVRKMAGIFAGGGVVGAVSFGLGFGMTGTVSRSGKPAEDVQSLANRNGDADDEAIGSSGERGGFHYAW
jgi:hypothetical protein